MAGNSARADNVGDSGYDRDEAIGSSSKADEITIALPVSP